MDRVQARDEQAFELLLQRHLHAVHAYIYRMCQNLEDAEDISQTTFYRVWDRAETWQPGRVKFTTWLFQIARNLCIDLFRKNKDQTDASFNLNELPDSSDRRDDELIVSLEKVIGELPERQRTTLVLCHVQGWSQKEVAEMLSLSVEAVESLLARARRTLRMKLADIRT